MTSWDPDQYLRFADERARPFGDLLDRVPVRDPADVVDLGCGPGTMTATLARRYPAARVLGIDSSAEMIAAAHPLGTERLRFRREDIAQWQPEPVDLIVSNAALQWVPRHTELFGRWVAAVRPGGALAFQVPAGGGGAVRQTIRAVVERPAWRDRLAAVAERPGPRTASPVRHPESYLDELARMGCTVDAWETTYYHVLHGEDPVLEWFRGTGLRPYLDALADDPAARAAFEHEVAVALRDAFPPQDYGTVLPFPRIFVVAQRPS
ncbi:methyltransferase domain-containing protein [Actinocatenispora sera]|uniref:Trans-aconitate 2-methyltransferase n=1 Tax=Actinocatenispora sera TaxID=390989 RepID=A0A810KY05_9ACTN|nr:methyltransferase domain-containing protein [Actinocatenispora sera]BCJ27279.1 trans-aconitate 2-methyltransferase [Actinocatenispora sera]